MTASVAQSHEATSTAANGSNTLAGVSAANVLFLLVAYIDTGSSTTVALPTPTATAGGGTWTAVDNPSSFIVNLGGTNSSVCWALFLCTNPGSGTNTVSYVPASGTSTKFYSYSNIVEVTGGSSYSLDQVAHNSFTGSASPQSSGATPATSGANVIAFTGCTIAADTGLTNAGVSNPATGGWTALGTGDQNTSTGVGSTEAYQLITGTGATPNATYSWSIDATIKGVFLSTVAVKYTPTGAPPSQLSTVRSGGSPALAGPFNLNQFVQRLGAIVPGVATAASGQTATFTQGTPTVTITYSATGQTATFTEGSPTPGVSYGATAQTATFTEGTPSVSTGGNVTVSATGQTATFTQGTPALSASYSATAQTATFTEGSPVGALAVGAGSLTATFTEGVPTIIAPGDVTRNATGLTATFTMGLPSVVVPAAPQSLWQGIAQAINDGMMIYPDVGWATSYGVAPYGVIARTPASDAGLPQNTYIAFTASYGTPQPGVPASVPSVVGLPAATAAAVIASAGFVAETPFTANSSTVAAGLVISQIPTAGTVANLGTGVLPTVSTGPAAVAPTTVTVPNVVGMNISTAKTALMNASLSPATVVYSATGGVTPVDAIVSQNPASGTVVPLWWQVNLIVSSG